MSYISKLREDYWRSLPTEAEPRNQRRPLLGDASGSGNRRAPANILEMEWLDNSAEKEAAAKASRRREAKKEAEWRAATGGYFSDNKRKTDYVLVYKTSAESGGEQKTAGKKPAMKRREFERYLIAQGLELEIEPAEKSCDKKTCFVKLHAPFDVLTVVAEQMGLKMPIKVADVDEASKKGILERLIGKLKVFQVDEALYPPTEEYFTAAFSNYRLQQFLMPADRERFFTDAQRSRMVFDLLTKTRYDPNRSTRVGIERLIKNGTYEAAYPLHNGDAIPKQPYKPEDLSERQKLYVSWAKWQQFYKTQPLDQIKSYFGAKIALYFTWLGFYNKALIPAAIIGIFCVAFGILSLRFGDPSDDICNIYGAGNITMCPHCSTPFDCHYWKMIASCENAVRTQIFDNVATVFFAAFMSIWATMFLEGWKRHHAEVSWDWDLDSGDQEDVVRPEFAARESIHRRLNPVTQQEEPYFSTAQKLVRYTASGISIIFFLSLVLAFVFGIIIYRMIIGTLIYNMFGATSASTITSVTAAVLNLICILVLGRIYQAMAWQLTTWECPRTQTDFEDSYTFKVFLFQFINYYSSLFYIAFIKGRFKLHKGGGKLRYTKLFSRRLEQCDESGCMLDLLVQLAVIMIGKQMFNNFMEILFPILKNWWRQRGARKSKADKQLVTRWEKDLSLVSLPPAGLFEEYLEMVIQFGFVTLFVAAFPLAPLFALVNNAFEVRLDAYKFVVAYRRPMPASARDIGVWTNILDGVSKMAVLANACVIAFTSDFVPETLFMWIVDTPWTMVGYTDWRLSYYEIPEHMRHKFIGDTHERYCRYRDFREAPCSMRNGTDCHRDYEYTLTWWYVLAARLAFVLVFEHLVFLIKGLIAYMIPDIPGKIAIKMKRERHLAKQALREYELHKNKARRAADQSGDTYHNDGDQGSLSEAESDDFA